MPKTKAAIEVGGIFITDPSASPDERVKSIKILEKKQKLKEVTVTIRTSGDDAYQTQGTKVDIKTAPGKLRFAVHPAYVEGTQGQFTKKKYTVTELTSGYSCGDGLTQTAAIQKAVDNWDNASIVVVDRLLRQIARAAKMYAKRVTK
jgi:hypothetical protein